LSFEIEVGASNKATSVWRSQRELVNRLREIRATGRIVLHIDPTGSDIASLPDLPHKHAGDYLRTAGGPNRNADKKQIFIIRADGSVVSRQYLDHTLWTDDKFDRQVIYPGDTIVIPEQLNKTTLLRGLTDWSQVFSQFALGAAAINLLK